MVLADSGTAGELAWIGAGAAALSLGVGLAAGSHTAVHTAVALLGGMFLLRQENRLVLAPAYGACLLLMEDLAMQTIELRGVALVAFAVIGARTAAILAVAAIGACGSAVAALAVTGAPGRSVTMTALAALTIVAAFAAIARLARARARGAPSARGLP